MSKLGECTTCTKYRTAECLGVARFDGATCPRYDNKADHPATTPKGRQPTRKSPLKDIVWFICLATVLIIVCLTIRNRNMRQQNAITIHDAEQMGLYHDDYVAWPCPEGFVCDTLSDGTWVFHRTDTIPNNTDTLLCRTSFRIVGFSLPQYTDLDQTAALLEWSHYKRLSRLTSDDSDTLDFAEYCHLAPLDFNTQFAWSRANFNWPADNNADNDTVLTLGTLYHPATHSGCHIYYTSVRRAEDYTYDLYTSVQYIRMP